MGSSGSIYARTMKCKYRSLLTEIYSQEDSPVISPNRIRR